MLNKAAGVFVMMSVVLMMVSVLSLAEKDRGVPVSSDVPVSGGSIFLDEFSGSVLDPAKWDVHKSNSVKPVVGDGLLTINTIPDGRCAISTKSDVLDFSKSPSQWTASIRFVVNNIETPSPSRQIMLLMPCSGFVSPPDTWEAIAFDLRLRKVKGNIWLAWQGYDGTGDKNGTRLATLKKGKYYTVTVRVRNNDQKVDIYLDSKLIATKDVLIGTGAGNVDQKYPDKLLVGTPTAPNIDMSIDFITVGVDQTKTK